MLRWLLPGGCPFSTIHLGHKQPETTWRNEMEEEEKVDGKSLLVDQVMQHLSCVAGRH